MSCVFRWQRKGFDTAQYLKKNPLFPAPYKEFDDGFCIAASEADFYDFHIQKQDVIAFLQRNYAELERLMAGDEVHGVLDFGIADLISEGEAAYQSDYLPAELLKLAGDLGIDIEISR